MRRWLTGACAALALLLAAALVPHTAQAGDGEPYTSGVYAILYDDGELVFQHGNKSEAGRTVIETYAVDLDAKYFSHYIEETDTYDKHLPPWHDAYNSILRVRFADRIQPTSTAYWFYQLHKLTAIDDMANLDTSHVTDTSSMFVYCPSLTKLDVSGFNTSSVTSMFNMFFLCSGLTELDVSGFDTSNVTDMAQMFWGCSSLTELDVTDFDTSSVTDIGGIFYDCQSLTELDVNSFDTSNVITMDLMFGDCNSLTELDVSGFDTSNVTDMSGMFDGCSGLTNLDVHSFDTSNVTDISFMFYGCSKLTELDVSSFDTSNVIDMSCMFDDCSGLMELDVSGFDTSNVTDMRSMFDGCSALTKIYVSEQFSVSAKGNYMFLRCKSLIGGSGTVYDESHIGEEYARIDGGPSAPGYFTYKESPWTTITLTRNGETTEKYVASVSGASVWCAAYDGAGRFLCAEPVAAGRVTVPDGAASARLFVLDDAFVPKARAVSVTF